MELTFEGGYRIRGFFRMPDRAHLENKDAPTYRERIAPTLITDDEYFATVEPRQEWYARHEKQRIKEQYGIDVEVRCI